MNPPNKYLSQTPRALPINKLLRASQLNIHIRVHAHEPAFVLGLAPFQTDQDGFVDSVALDRVGVGHPCAAGKVGLGEGGL